MVGGRIAPGQRFDTTSVAAAPVAADVFDGRLRATWGSVALPIGVDGVVTLGNLRNAELRTDLDAAGVRRGHLGGVLSVATLLMELTPHPMVPTRIIELFVNDNADLQPGSDPAFCSDYSMAMDFAGVSATRNP